LFCNGQFTPDSLTEVKAKLQRAADSLEMTLANKKRCGFLAFFFVGLFTINISAHTLPISYLTLVPDGNYLHLELTLNPFELNFSSKPDASLETGENGLSKRILQHIKIKVDGKLLSAETAGLSGEGGSHHLTLRAHFPVANPQATLSIESDLSAITSASHLTEVTLIKGGEHQLARLDSQEHLATFAPEIKKNLEKATAATPNREGSATPGFLVILPLTMLPMVLGLFLVLKFTKNLRRPSTSHL